MSVILYFRSLREFRGLAYTSPINLPKLFSCARKINANIFAVRRVNLRPHIQLLSAGYYVFPYYVNSKAFTRSALE